jgi:hypothetical protein
MSADIPEKEAVRPEETGTHAEDSEKKSANTTPPVASKSDAVPAIHNTRTSKRKTKCWLEWGKFSVEVLTLLVVSIYTRIAYHQWNAMLQSNQINHAALVATQRAYISVTGLHIEKSTFNPKLVSYIVSPVVVNSGNTPTKNLWWTAVVGTPPLDVDHEPTVEDLATASHNYGTLAARQEVNDLIKQPIPTEYAATLRQSNSQKHIPIYGAIVYEDGISDPPVIHVRRYCYSLYVNPYFTPPTGFSYVMCGGRSNCEDGECDAETQEQMKKIRSTAN